MAYIIGQSTCGKCGAHGWLLANTDEVRPTLFDADYCETCDTDDVGVTAVYHHARLWPELLAIAQFGEARERLGMSTRRLMGTECKES